MFVKFQAPIKFRKENRRERLAALELKTANLQEYVGQISNTVYQRLNKVEARLDGITR